MSSHPQLDKGRVIIDSTRFVADPEKARNFPELPYVTVRLGSMAGVHFNADYGLAIVRPEHQAFYRRVFLHETWCEPRLFPGLVKPVGLMAAHLPTVRDKVLARYPFLRSSAFERRILFDRGASALRRPMRWLPPSSLPRSSRVPEPAEPRRLQARLAGGRGIHTAGVRYPSAGALLPHADAPNLGLGPVRACLHHRATFTNH